MAMSCSIVISEEMYIMLSHFSAVPRSACEVAGEKRVVTMMDESVGARESIKDRSGVCTFNNSINLSYAFGSSVTRMLRCGNMKEDDKPSSELVYRPQTRRNLARNNRYKGIQLLSMKQLKYGAYVGTFYFYFVCSLRF